MEENRGYLGANTYALPTVAPEPVTPLAPQPYDDGVRAMEGLQFVKGQTEAYYKKIADLKSFMQGAHANLGIDVRVPDMSKPESIKLHQIYNDAITDILQTGNSLKNSHGIESQLTNMRAQYAPGVDPKAQSADQLVQGKDYWFGLQDLVKENNDFQQQAHDSGNIEEAKQKYNETVQYLQSQKDGSNDAAIDYQIQGLVPPRSVRDRTFTPQRVSWQEKKYGSDIKQAEQTHSKILHLTRGASKSFKAEPAVAGLTPEGNPYLISREFQGKKIGNSVLDYWKQDPDLLDSEGNPTMSIVLKDGTEMTVSTQDAVSLTSQLAGTNVDFIMDALDRRGVLDANSQVDVNKVLNPEYKKTIENNIKLAKNPTTISKQAKKELEDVLLNTETTGIFTDDPRIPAGKYSIRLTRKDGFKIENIDKIGTSIPKYNSKGAEKDRKTYLKKNTTFPQTKQGVKDLIKFLDDNGAVIENYRSKNSKQRVGVDTQSIKPGTEVVPTKKSQELDPDI